MPAERRARRLALYERVQLLYHQGKSKRQIAQELQISRWLVRRFVEADQFPERAPKSQRRTTILTPFEPVLQERWQQGERTAPPLFRVLQAEGYSGSIHTVRHWVQQRRQEPAPHTNPAYRATYTVEPEQSEALAAAQWRLPLARQLVWLLLNDADDLSSDDQQLLSLLREEPSIASAYTLAQQFLHLMRQRDLSALDGWLTACWASAVPDLANFASGLQQDDAAVRAALTLSRQICSHPATQTHVIPGNAALPLHNGIIITRGLQEWTCLLPQELPFASAARLLGVPDP
jgi:transposase